MTGSLANRFKSGSQKVATSPRLGARKIFMDSLAPLARPAAFGFAKWNSASPAMHNASFEPGPFDSPHSALHNCLIPRWFSFEIIACHAILRDWPMFEFVSVVASFLAELTPAAPVANRHLHLFLADLK